MTQPSVIVTTSWDDGDPSDLRVAELLRSRNLKGTFYVPLVGHAGGPVLQGPDLRSLTREGLEIGAHTLTHRVLSKLDHEELATEVGVCKTILEDTLGSAIHMFCYPKGRFNSSVVSQVKASGYKGARTTQWLYWGLPFDPFRMPTTLQAYPHGKWPYVRNTAKAENVSGLYRYVTDLRRLDTWIDVGKKLFDSVLQNGGIWHLYGHSWEIERHSLWNDLGEMLDYVCNRQQVLYLSNCELLPFNAAGPAAVSRHFSPVSE